MSPSHRNSLSCGMAVGVFVLDWDAAIIASTYGLLIGALQLVWIVWAICICRGWGISLLQGGLVVKWCGVGGSVMVTIDMQFMWKQPILCNKPLLTWWFNVLIDVFIGLQGWERIYSLMEEIYHCVMFSPCTCDMFSPCTCDECDFFSVIFHENYVVQLLLVQHCVPINIMHY